MTTTHTHQEDPVRTTARRSLRALSLAAVTALAAAGCGGISSGTVTDKYVSPGYTYFVQTAGTCSGNPPICSPGVLVPIVVPTTWVLTLEDCSGGTGRAGEECETGRVDVDPGVYDDVQVGDRYEAPDGDG